MCGLFAAFSTKNKIKFDYSRYLELVNLYMGHRGPDKTGVFFSEEKNVFLAHTRLAIQDLSSKADQPFLSPDNSQLIYNGEIYNSKLISETLGIKNPRSDTDLLSKLLCEENLNYLKLIEGMFAFVKYCPRRKKIFFGRDYFGEKPLYIFHYENYTFLFSEIYSLKIAKHILGIDLEIDINAVTRFLLYGYRQVNSSENGISFFSNLKAILPGSINIFDLNTGLINSEKINCISNDFIKSKEDSIFTPSQLKKVILDNVSDRSIADVKTGVSLSGGIDSNLITSILCKSKKPPNLAFTIKSNDQRYSESSIAEFAASKYGIKHKSVDINDFPISPVKNFLKLSSSRKSPFLTLTSFVSWYIANEAKNSGIKVMFSGVGGDELFSGYYDHFYFRQNDKNITASEIEDFKKYIFPNIRNPILGDFENASSKVNTFTHHYEDLEERLNLLYDNNNLLFPRITFIPGKTQLRSRLFSEIKDEVIPIILHEDDLNYMNCSVENRSPLLSRKIFLESLKIQDRFLFSNGYQKNPLREIALNLIPEEIRLNRKKIGFNYSIWDFINSDYETVQDLLNLDSLLWDLLNKQKFKNLFQKKLISEKFLFCIISLQAFLLDNKNG